MANAPNSTTFDSISSSSNNNHNIAEASTRRLTSAALSTLPTTTIAAGKSRETTTTTAPPSAQGSVLNLSTLRSRLSRIRSSKKSTGTRSTVSSVPVLVRSYPVNYAYGPARPLNTAAGPATLRRMEALPSLPPVAEFAFSHVLLTVDTDIQDPLDAISSICARSRYSLADEYGAHLPPQGEISGSINHRPFNGRHGLFIRTTALADSALSVVHEASNSSAASDSGTMRSAYGSLRNVLSRRGTGRNGRSEADETSELGGHNGHTWAVKSDGKESIVLVGEPQPLRQILSEPVAEPLTQADTTTNSSRPWFSISQASFGIPWFSSTPRERSSRTTTAEIVLRNLLNSAPPGFG